MTSLYNQFKTDPELEKAGLWLEYGPNSKKQEQRIRIARAGGANTQFQKRMEALTKPYRRQIQTEIIGNDVVQRLMRQAYAETVVLGWENIEGPNGEDIPFSVENCVQLFTDLPDLFTDVQEQAQKAVLFRAEVREADAGN